jgi:hypothetical protein
VKTPIPIDRSSVIPPLTYAWNGGMTSAAFVVEAPPGVV